MTAPGDASNGSTTRITSTQRPKLPRVRLATRCVQPVSRAARVVGLRLRVFWATATSSSAEVDDVAEEMLRAADRNFDVTDREPRSPFGSTMTLEYESIWYLFRGQFHNGIKVVSVEGRKYFVSSEHQAD